MCNFYMKIDQKTDKANKYKWENWLKVHFY